jgi:hypothetical protein
VLVVGVVLTGTVRTRLPPLLVVLVVAVTIRKQPARTAQLVKDTRAEMGKPFLALLAVVVVVLARLVLTALQVVAVPVVPVSLLPSPGLLCFAVVVEVPASTVQRFRVPAVTVVVVVVSLAPVRMEPLTLAVVVAVAALVETAVQVL